MAYGGGGAAAAARAAAIAQAIKASGAIVQVEPDDFLTILSKTDKPLAVMATGGLMKTNYQYLTAYKGLIFLTTFTVSSVFRFFCSWNKSIHSSHKAQIPFRVISCPWWNCLRKKLIQK